ncbi:MAG: hypothetical protein ACTH07_08880 [Microbacterium sp.]
MEDIPWKAIWLVGGGVLAIALFGIISVWGQDFINNALTGFGIS